MKLNPIIPLFVAIALPTFVFAEDNSKPGKFEELPPSVANAIKEAAGNESLKKIELGHEDGKPAYEAVWNANGHKHEITVAVDGKVLGLEEVIPLAEAPEAVRTAIAKDAGEGKVTEVEKVIEGGKTFFEAVIASAKGKVELKLDASGAILERESGEDDEKVETPEKKSKKKD